MELQLLAEDSYFKTIVLLLQVMSWIVQCTAVHIVSTHPYKVIHECVWVWAACVLVL